MELIYLDNLPFNIVTGVGFKNFIHAINPGITIPSRNTIAQSMLPVLYQKKCDDLKIILKNYHYYGATNDIWTSIAMDAFISLTVHFINKNWERKHFIYHWSF